MPGIVACLNGQIHTHVFHGLKVLSHKHITEEKHFLDGNTMKHRWQYICRLCENLVESLVSFHVWFSWLVVSHGFSLADQLIQISNISPVENMIQTFLLPLGPST